MKSTFMKKLLLTTLFILFALAITACGSAEEDVVLNPDADDPAITDTEWATEIWNDAIDKLCTDGHARKSDVDGVLLECLDSGMIDLAASADLEADFIPDGKVIWGWADVSRSEDAQIYIDTHHQSSDEEEDADIPAYASDFADETTPAEAFAKSRGRCKYLMLTVGLCYNIVPDYYMGPVDRRDVSTHVFVIDAVERKVVHIRYFGSDVPGMSTTSAFGNIDVDAGRAYLNGICDR